MACKGSRVQIPPAPPIFCDKQKIGGCRNEHHEASSRVSERGATSNKATSLMKCKVDAETMCLGATNFLLTTILTFALSGIDKIKLFVEPRRVP